MHGDSEPSSSACRASTPVAAPDAISRVSMRPGRFHGHPEGEKRIHDSLIAFNIPKPLERSLVPALQNFLTVAIFPNGSAYKGTIEGCACCGESCHGD